jgi:phosphonate transport system permease protein
VTTATEAIQIRPEAPRRAWSMGGALTMAVVAGVAGAAAAIPAYGALWGLIAAAALIVAIHMGKVPVDNLDRALIVLGLTASTVLATRVLPFAPQDVDVLLCLQFAGAWAPAAVATSAVLARLGTRPTSVVNTGIAWLLGGAFSLPAAETLGILTPISSLRRGVEPVFGTGDYMAIGLVVFAAGSAAFLAAAARLPALAATAIVVLFTVFAGASVGFTIPGLIENIAGIVNIPNFWPPDFAWAIGDGTWWWLPSWEFGAPLRANPLVETIRIGVTATVLGCAIALPLAFMASTLTAINHRVYLVAKGFMNVTRTIPDLFWAVILVASVGGGPFAGAVALSIFAMAIMAKLFSETIDGADPGPLEAAKATGSRHFPAVRASVLPQVLPNYVAYALYIFELTIRASAIVGLVGAGGIGRVLEVQRVFYRFDRILAIVIVIVILVFVLEQISVALRRRLV